jgi:hypothetical protein
LFEQRQIELILINRRTFNMITPEDGLQAIKLVRTAVDDAPALNLVDVAHGTLPPHVALPELLARETVQPEFSGSMVEGTFGGDRQFGQIVDGVQTPIDRSVGSFTSDQFAAAHDGTVADRERFIATLGIPPGTIRDGLAHAALEANASPALEYVSRVQPPVGWAQSRAAGLESVSAAMEGGSPNDIEQALRTLYTPTDHQSMKMMFGE